MPGFLSSTTALTVYKIDNPAGVTADKLKQFAFQSIDDIPEPKGWGWVNIDDMFDTEWHLSVPEKGHYMCFSLRIDTRKVSSAVLKKHMAEALSDEEAKAAAEGNKVTRKRKKELKELYTAKLMKQAEPVPAALDVAVDMESGQVLVSSVSAAQLALFEQHFRASFPQELEHIVMEPEQGQRLLVAAYEHGLTPPVGEYTFSLQQGGEASLVQSDSGATVTVKDEPDTIDKARQTGLTFSRLKLRLTRQDDDSL
ncbi:MAG: recombination-associated protein RdgC, partial [Bilophila sp.]